MCQFPYNNQIFVKLKEKNSNHADEDIIKFFGQQMTKRTKCCNMAIFLKITNPMLSF